ncbi:hypothetical protein N7495_000897 [Penicillium taxi]|uniref:uncharacterized protein n=1 Tax=Penicillium taxi TaxID=168475 RepID=UPI0025458774|nr:uncharacterized protein N7495_000897 [Penicillium taxi]KAJ5908215.1 hypothetical protein N7495_000897 [Penicillium taxi]
MDPSDPSAYVDPQLTFQDKLVLEVLSKKSSNGDTKANAQKLSDDEIIKKLEGMNNPSDPSFDPTIFQLWENDVLRAKLPEPVQRFILQPYVEWAKGVVRVPTDVVMLTHLILYFTTIVPSAFYLFYHFTWIHGILHWALMGFYCGAFTLMRHQHIHGNGILAPQYWVLDTLFPYLLDPLHGHTWNSYFYHHMKHHHVEGNGPYDLSSTMFYDRDSVLDFACYVGRFFFFIWVELPLYFFNKGQYKNATRAAFWELSNYLTFYCLYNYVNARATVFVLILPFIVMRIGLMCGNWGQHALVDASDPESDWLSSITLIDVPSNRFSYNDGYHTSHHLNPRRHWRDHPVAFLKQKDRYAEERALVFRNIDYIFITVHLLRKNYIHLAKCLIPTGPHANMTVEERAEMLRGRARRFSPDYKKQN